MPSVTIVVVNRDRSAMLRECLISLLGQTYRDFEIVVVDNGSADDSLSVIAEIEDSRVRAVPLNRNLGFSGGCNAGIRASQGGLIALLNNDAVAEPGWLQALVDGLVDERVGMCASRIRFWGSEVIDKAGHLIFWDGQNRGRGTGDKDGPCFDRFEECLFPDGCAALYRRELLEQTGGFDEDFFAYADDADLGLRARLAGWTARYCPAALVYHRHSSTSGRFSPQKVYWVERNRLWLAVKSFPLALLALGPLFTAYRFSWYLVGVSFRKGSAARFLESGSRWSLVRSILRANMDGLRGVPRMWTKRRRIRANRVLSDRQFLRLLWKFRITARALALNEP